MRGWHRQGPCGEDLTATDSSLKGFRSRFSEGTYDYVLPVYKGAYFGKVARFNLMAFGNVEVLDLTATNCHLKGVSGGSSEGTYGYIVPEYTAHTSSRALVSV